MVPLEGTGLEDPPPYQLARSEVPSSLSVEVVTPGSEPSLSPPPEEEEEELSPLEEEEPP